MKTLIARHALITSTEFTFSRWHSPYDKFKYLTKLRWYKRKLLPQTLSNSTCGLALIPYFNTIAHTYWN